LHKVQGLPVLLGRHVSTWVHCRGWSAALMSLHQHSVQIRRDDISGLHKVIF
jgi:hypothetical protein